MVYTVKRSNKFGAKKTTFNGRRFDSKHEASVAMWLQSEKESGKIIDYDCQFKVLIPIYDQHGKKVHEVSHKVDFRAHNNDGSFSLIEAKGFDTPDWKFRRRLLEAIWLESHQDHTYEVIYNRARQPCHGRKTKR